MITLPADSKVTTAAFRSAGAAIRLVHSKFTAKQVSSATASIGQRDWHPAAEQYTYGFYFDPRRNVISLGTDAPEAVVAPLLRANPGLSYYHHESEAGLDTRQ